MINIKLFCKWESNNHRWNITRHNANATRICKNENLI